MSQFFLKKGNLNASFRSLLLIVLWYFQDSGWIQVSKCCRLPLQWTIPLSFLAVVYFTWKENTQRCNWTETLRQLQEKTLIRFFSDPGQADENEQFYAETTKQRQLKRLIYARKWWKLKISLLLALQILGNCWLMKIIYVEYQLDFHFLELLCISEIITHFPSATFLSALAQWQKYLKDNQLYSNGWTKETKNFNVPQN